MKIHALTLHPYQFPITGGPLRSGVLINIIDDQGVSGWGDIAPLPKWSKETIEQCIAQFSRYEHSLLTINWTALNCLDELSKLSLYPSLSFGIESALLSILRPLPPHTVQTSALLMGSPKEIIEQANLRLAEGFTSAKLKVGNLSFDEAFQLIHQLKNRFHLRIDVNRAWDTTDSLQFFSQFPINSFDYVEEPFKNPKDLIDFPHPLAIDESYPDNLNLDDLHKLPTLKAIIYKPTIQGGLIGCLALNEWTIKQGVALVLSSSFESHIGLTNIASIAYRLSLHSPIGIGTAHFMSTSNSVFPPILNHSSAIRINLTSVT